MRQDSSGHELPAGLRLRTAQDASDLERVAAFNGVIHGAGVAAMSRALFLHHPAMRPENVWFVEDEATGEAVSSLCLIPWTWHYGEVTLQAGELGIVGTLEGHRRRGLIRAQTQAFQQRLREQRYDLSHIQGIPFFYRQFGYEYAMPLEGGYDLEFHQIPDDATGDEALSFRRAGVADIPLLQRFFDEAARDLPIHTVRDEAIWRYLLQHTADTEMETEAWLVEEKGQPVGYLQVALHGFSQGLIISEASPLGYDQAVALLQQARRWAVERLKPHIRLRLPAGNTLVQVACGLGARDTGHYAWQIHLPDRAAFLGRLAPLLESRLAGSPFMGMTRRVELDLYTERLLLCFVEGRLKAVEVVEGNERAGSRIRIPLLLLAPLVLGYRTFEELRAAHHDVSAEATGSLLAGVLFPRVASYIHTIY